MNTEIFKIVFYIATGGLFLFIGAALFTIFSQMKTEKKPKQEQYKEVIAKDVFFNQKKQIEEIITEVDSVATKMEAVFESNFKRLSRETKHLENLIEQAQKLILKYEEIKAEPIISPSINRAATMAYKKELPVEMPVPPKNDLNSRIFEMYSQGKDIKKIAAEMSMDKGEIELILNLRGRLS